MSDSESSSGTRSPRPGSERRSANRFKTQVPVTINFKSGEKLTAQSRDLSLGGIFLYTNQGFENGSELELVLVLPPELTGGQKQWVCCQGSVIRVEKAAGGGFGVAARLDAMSALPELPS
jgi:hypothetical protein